MALRIVIGLLEVCFDHVVTMHQKSDDVRLRPGSFQELSIF